MILYHGSEYVIERPVYGGGKPYNDYGRGFYCTEFPDMGREWSVTSEHGGYLNKYELDDTELDVLDLKEHSVMTWLAVLLSNRHFDAATPLAREAKRYIIDEFSIDCGKYDLIRGYRADDSYFSFARDFINGEISYDELGRSMQLGELGEQIVLKSRRAFERITFLEFERVPAEIWLPKRQARDEKARRAYFDLDKKYVKGALYVTRILDEEIRKDDPRIR